MVPAEPGGAFRCFPHHRSERRCTLQYAIIGNGIAGVYAAEAIRELDDRGRIVMVGDENTTPYSRPMISMVLEGAVPHERLPIRPPDFYRRWNIETVLGERVTALDVAGKRLCIGRDRWLSYDRLLIASGADPRPVHAAGHGMGNIFYLRTQAHAKHQVIAAATARKALVLGGGLVGFKAAYGLLKRGIDVTLLIASGYPLSLQVDRTAGHMILDELLANGLRVKVGVSVESFTGNGTVSGAVLSDGTELPCDMVVVGKGVLPALSFVPRDRVPVDLGILVDAHMAAGAPDIYAAGDAAESVDIARQTRWVNAIWPEAAAQGRIAGMNMAGRKAAYPGSLGRNTMRILGLDLTTIGLVNPPADGGFESIHTLDNRRRVYRKLVFRKDRLVGCLLLNRIEQGGVFFSLIRNAVPLNGARSRLLSPSFNFSRLLF